ncbi:TniB family NTP-binding protein [Pseudoxanthomonas mexicana]
METDRIDDALVRRVSTMFVPTSDCKSAVEPFDVLLAAGAAVGGLCLLICGESGVGKSTLIRWLTKNLRSVKTDAGWSRPAIFVEVPASPTAIAVCEALLDALGDPRPSAGTRPQKFRRLREKLAEQQVRLLVLDDLQHVFDRESERVLFDASEGIKQILVEHPMSILCAGLADASKVVESNEQLKRRHMATVHLRRFDWNSARSRSSFVAVLSAVVQALGDFEFPDLEDEGVAVRFYLGSGGIMDFIFKIFLLATWFAMKAKKRTVGMREFSRAWKVGLLHSAGQDDPFTADMGDEENLTRWVEKAKQINLPSPRQPKKRRASSRLRETGL